MSEHRHDHQVYDPDHFDWNAIYTGELGDYQPPNQLILRATESSEPGAALDLGCGAGGLAVSLARRGWRVHAIDISPNAITAARKVAREHGVDATFEVADATTWKPNRQYDLVVSSFALPGRISEREVVFATVRDLLSSGGKVVIEDFDTGMTRTGLFENCDLVTVEELLTAFDGFDILRCEIVDTPPHDHDGSGAHRGERWTAAFLNARAP